MWLFMGCSEELSLEDYSDDSIVLDVFNSHMTKSTDEGADYERLIYRLDCFFYLKGQTSSNCIYYHKEDLSSSPQDGSKKVVLRFDDQTYNDTFFSNNATECEVFVIANLPENIQYSANQVGTDVATLSNYSLSINQSTQNYDAIGKPFVMAASATIPKDSKDPVAVPLRRAAAKLTVKVNVPASITVKDINGVDQIWVPVLDDDGNVAEMYTSFHNGESKSYLYSSEPVADGALFTSSSVGYVKAANQERDAVTYSYNCEVPFYTYARYWSKGANDAAYITLQMKWKRSGQEGSDFPTYYYQILVNGAGRSFEPNHWYDMTINVGVLGSTVDTEPKQLHSMSYYVLDWTSEPFSTTGDRHESITMENYKYFELENPFLELDNLQIGSFRYAASGHISWSVYKAYYINNSGVSELQVSLPITEDNFYDNYRGTLVFEYDIPSNIYSPVYVNGSIWLDLNKNGQLDEDEKEYSQQYQIISRPAMYVERDNSQLRSIYLNGKQGGNQSLGTYNLGSSDGIRNTSSVMVDGVSTTNDKVNYSMFIITVTSFDEDDKFYAPELDDKGYFSGVGAGRYSNGSWTAADPQPATIQYNYIIGDPRETEPNIGLYANVGEQWASERAIYDENGDIAADNYKRQLKFYYPTKSSGDAFQIVAPKYRIVSFNNASGKNCDEHSAAMRCAALQEDGFPAGRWRLPTIAEIQFIIKLQEEGAIQEIFTSTGSYYATASYGNVNRSTRISVAYRNGKMSWNNIGNNISVRCVYDDWYWGSDRSAKEKPEGDWNRKYTDYKGEENVGDKYYFTWGDREM